MSDKFKKIIQFGFIILIFVNILSFQRTEEFDYKTFFLNLTFSLLFLLWSFSLCWGKIYFKKNLFNFLVLSFFFLNLISFLFSPYPLASALQFYQVFVYTGIYIIFLSVFHNLKDIERFVHFLLLSIFLVSFYGILQYWGGDFLRISHKRIVFSTFINKNFLGGVLAINLPFFLLSLFRAEGIFKKIIYFLGTCVVIYALILTGSKGGILVGIMGILFFISFSFLKQIKEKKMRKRLIILGTIFFVPMGIKVFPWFYSRNCPMSLKERFPFWRLSLRMIGAHPFRGVGIGNFVLFAPGYKPSLFSPEQFIRHAWNEFLEIWAELGFLGFLSFIILLILVSIYALKIIFQQNKESFISIVSLGGLASLFSGILLNLGEINLRIVYLGIYFWISLAILIKIKEIDLDKRVTFFNFPSFFKKICFLFFIFADLCLLKFIFTPLLMYKIAQKKASYGYKITDLDRLENLESELKDSPSLYNNLGNLYLLNGDMEKAKEYYQRALELNPSFSSTNYNLGYIYFLEGKIREAYEKFSFCLKLNPRDADSYFMLKKNILY